MPGPRKRAQHAVDMARGAGAALHRKPHRLVEHQHVGVFVQRDRLDEGAVLLRLRRVVARFRRVELERRNAHRLAGFQPALRLGALAVHPHLALADDALDMAERQAGKARLEEAVDAHAVLVRRDGDGLHGGGKLHGLGCGHRRRWRRHERLFARRPRGKGAASPAVPFRRMLHAQVGLARIGALARAFLISFVAVAAKSATLSAPARTLGMTTAARARALLAAAIAALAHSHVKSSISADTAIQKQNRTFLIRGDFALCEKPRQS